jgi:hypothetical protein
MKHTTAWLAAINVAFVVILGWQWWSWPGPDAAGNAGQGEAVAKQARSATPATGAEVSAPVENYAEITERVLFLETRRLPAIPDVTAEAEAAKEVPKDRAVARPELSFAGIVITPDTRYALVRKASGDFQRLAEGDEINGWRVERATASELLLTDGERVERFALRDYPEYSLPTEKKRRSKR